MCACNAYLRLCDMRILALKLDSAERIRRKQTRAFLNSPHLIGRSVVYCDAVSFCPVASCRRRRKARVGLRATLIAYMLMTSSSTSTSKII